MTAEPPRFNNYARHRNSCDVVGCRGGLRARANAVNFSIRQVLAEIIKDRLESALVSQITLAKVPQEADLFSLPFSFFQIFFPSRYLLAANLPKGSSGFPPFPKER